MKSPRTRKASTYLAVISLPIFFLLIAFDSFSQCYVSCDSPGKEVTCQTDNICVCEISNGLVSGRCKTVDSNNDGLELAMDIIAIVVEERIERNESEQIIQNLFGENLSIVSTSYKFEFEGSVYSIGLSRDLLFRIMSDR